jgi:hypothetical protein
MSARPQAQVDKQQASAIQHVRRSLAGLGYFCLYSKLSEHAPTQKKNKHSISGGRRGKKGASSATALATAFSHTAAAADDACSMEAVAAAGLSADNALPAVYEVRASSGVLPA